MSIFDSGPKAESAEQLCKPDPEEMIERANKRKQSFQRAAELFDELDELPIHLHRIRGSEEYFLQVYGSVYAGIRECDKEIQRWMNEIDKNEDT